MRNRLSVAVSCQAYVTHGKAELEQSDDRGEASFADLSREYLLGNSLGVDHFDSNASINLCLHGALSRNLMKVVSLVCCIFPT